MTPRRRGWQGSSSTTENAAGPEVGLDEGQPLAWRGKETEVLTLTIRYARYALAALSSVGFGLAQN
jgi:hypothetical protein